VDQEAFRAEFHALLGATRAWIEFHRGAGSTGLPEVPPATWPPRVDDLLAEAPPAAPLAPAALSATSTPLSSAPPSTPALPASAPPTSALPSSAPSTPAPSSFSSSLPPSSSPAFSSVPPPSSSLAPDTVRTPEPPFGITGLPPEAEGETGPGALSLVGPGAGEETAPPPLASVPAAVPLPPVEPIPAAAPLPPVAVAVAPAEAVAAVSPASIPETPAPPPAPPSPLFEDEPMQPSLFGPGDVQETPLPRQIRPAGPVDLPPPRTPEAHRRLEVLAGRIQGCSLCVLHQQRKQTVFARGNPDADLCFIGEAPGADEDEQGSPFVGRAGQLLDRMIAAMGLQQDEVYITNICRCRPPGNRTPSAEEMSACMPYLHEQLALVQPRVIVALGATATKGLLQTSLGIRALRGTWKLYRRTTPVMPTYHPAYLLRETEAGRLDAKRDVWKDLQAVLERLGRPIPSRGKK
jgi:uracil-DNA glycosylase family 4